MQNVFVTIASIALLALLQAISVASAQTVLPSPDVQHITPTPGFKAVMNVYWVDVKTLDIVAESSYWFPTGDACTDAEPKGLAIAQEAAGPGYEAVLECKTLFLDGHTIKPFKPDAPKVAPPRGTTDL